MIDQKKLKNLNRRILARQYLSRRASGPHAVVKVAEACRGVNSQDYEEFARYSEYQATKISVKFQK